jgi:coenzyme F420 hydrogenase subunit beta
MKQIFGSKELLEDVHQRDLCIGCGACVDLCPYLKNYKGKTAMLFPCTLPEGRCHAYCPKAEVDLDELSSSLLGKPYDGSPLLNYLEILAARAGEEMEKGAFQAGGTVSALMTFALKTSLIDAAVLTDQKDMVAVPRLITRAKEVGECAATKFTAAPTLSALNRGAKDGYHRMGVVGTPCQVMAVTQMRANPLGREGFTDPVALVVGLFCTWALDTRQLMAFLSERVDISQVRRMDIPPPPAEILVLETRKERVEIPLNEIRPLIPKACQICPDMTSEWSDVSVGELEGEPRWNTLIIRTDKGARLVKDAVAAGYLIIDKMPEGNLNHLCSAAAGKKKRALVRAQDEGLLNTTDEQGRSALRLRADVVERIFAKDTEELCQP